MRAGVVLSRVLLLIVGLPLWSLLAKGFEDRDGKFVGLANYSPISRRRRCSTRR
jgi:iron(III) transport system permease protein